MVGAHRVAYATDVLDVVASTSELSATGRQQVTELGVGTVVVAEVSLHAQKHAVGIGGHLDLEPARGTLTRVELLLGPVVAKEARTASC